MRERTNEQTNKQIIFPVDNFGTVVGEIPTPYRILALWAVNCLLGYKTKHYFKHKTSLFLIET